MDRRSALLANHPRVLLEAVTARNLREGSVSEDHFLRDGSVLSRVGWRLDDAPLGPFRASPVLHDPFGGACSFSIPGHETRRTRGDNRIAQTVGIRLSKLRKQRS